MNKYKSIILIGPQGSGKGTQAHFLIPKLSAEYLEAGALLRQEAKKDTPLGQDIKSHINDGQLISDELWQAVVKSKLESFGHEKIVIIDGSPRTIGQAEILIDYLNSAGRTPIATFHINVPRQESVKRLQNRRICEDCQKPAILQTLLDQGQEVLEACIKCGGKLIVRHDDQDIGAINHRLDLYELETKPVLDYLRKTTDFFEIDGTGSIENVSDQIGKTLDLE